MPSTVRIPTCTDLLSYHSVQKSSNGVKDILSIAGTPISLHRTASVLRLFGILDHRLSAGGGSALHILDTLS